MNNKKDLHIFLNQKLYEKIVSVSKNDGIPITKTVENLLEKSFVKKTNDYAELINFLDNRIVKKVDISLINFKYFLQAGAPKNAAGGNNKPAVSEPEKPAENKPTGQAFAAEFFNKLNNKK